MTILAPQQPALLAGTVCSRYTIAGMTAPPKCGRARARSRCRGARRSDDPLCEEWRPSHRLPGSGRRALRPGLHAGVHLPCGDELGVALLDQGPGAPVPILSGDHLQTNEAPDCRDRVGGWPTLEERMDDIPSGGEAAGSERAALNGISEGGPMCMVFAALYPERTSALVLHGTGPCLVAGPDWPWGLSAEMAAPMLDEAEAGWGSGTVLSYFIQGTRR